MEPFDIRSWPWDSEDVIQDPMKKVPGTNLFHGTCKMGPFMADIMIRKAPEIKKRTYDLLKGFQHDSFIPHLNFYMAGEANNHGRLVIPKVRWSFKYWITADGGKKCLFNANGKMSPLFKKMILDLCDLVQKLYDIRILIESLVLDNLYLAAEIDPRILVLVTKAEATKDVNRNFLWSPLQNLVESIYKECGFDLKNDLGAKRYLGFIWTAHFTLSAMERYPYNWDEKAKKEYMIALIVAKQCGDGGIRSLVVKAHINWPKVDGELPQELMDVIDHQGSRGVYYLITIPVDYIRLIRNTYKHFEKLPSHIKRIFGTRNGFIKMIEQWSPNLWMDLYDTIGWP